MNNYRGWHLIDLHMHTVQGITRDLKTDDVNFSYSKFIKAVSKYKIELLAVTNHNIIDFENLILLKYLCHIDGINILMGVELDSNLESGHALHIATIFNTDFIPNYQASKEINSITNKMKIEQNEIIYSPENITKILRDYDILLIPHGDKSKGAFEEPTAENIHECLKKISEGFIRIFDSPSNWKLAKIKEFLAEEKYEDLCDFGGVLFSDCRDWDNYDKKFRNFYMNAEPTFLGLVHSITNPTMRFAPFFELKENHNYIQKITFKNNSAEGKIEDGEICLSPSYNCIIGKSGSGKSLLLHLIKKTLMRGEDETEKYQFAYATDVHFYDENDGEIFPETINIASGANIYSKIISAIATKSNGNLYAIAKQLDKSFIEKETFNAYKDQYTKRVKEYCQETENLKKYQGDFIETLVKFSKDIDDYNELKETQTFGISAKQFKPQYTKEKVESLATYSDYINLLRELQKQYIGKYKDQLIHKLDEIDCLYKLALLDMKSTYFSENVILEKQRNINSAINEINGDLSKNAKRKSNLINEMPETINKLSELAINVYKTKIKLKHCDLSIDINLLNSVKAITEDKSVIVEEIVDEDEIKKVNEKNNNIFKTRGHMTSLNPCGTYNMSISKDAKQLIDLYITNNVISSDQCVPFENIEPVATVKFDGSDIKQLNPGDIAKKYIDTYFESQITNSKNNVVLYDQIENDVDKPFIADVIKKKIDSTKGTVQLIIVTHDPIIAVNADPVRYVECKKNQNNIISYRDFLPESPNNELNTIAEIVDGSKSVIKNRYEIYQGERK